MALGELEALYSARDCFSELERAITALGCFRRFGPLEPLQATRSAIERVVAFRHLQMFEHQSEASLLLYRYLALFDQ